MSLGFKSFRIIAWRDWTGSHTKCRFLDAVWVKYRKGTYSVTNVTSVPWDMGMSTAFLAVLWAVRSVASFEEIWDAVVGSCLYSQTPLQFWRVMAGCIAIGLLATAVHWFVFFILHEPIMCSYNCMIEICFSWRGKTIFSHTKRRFLDAVLVPISQGTEVTIVTEHVLSPFSIGSTLSISRAQEFEFTTATVSLRRMRTRVFFAAKLVRPSKIFHFCLIDWLRTI